MCERMYIRVHDMYTCTYMDVAVYEFISILFSSYAGNGNGCTFRWDGYLCETGASNGSRDNEECEPN